jgi:hypothetical protein
MDQQAVQEGLCRGQTEVETRSVDLGGIFSVS